MSQQYTLSDLSKALGKDALAISTIQKGLKLPVLDGDYSASYMYLLKKVMALRSFRVSLDKIAEILETEKKILKLLHFDSNPDLRTWYLEGCNGIKGLPSNPKQTLLLTGFDLGFALDGDAVQENLNFGKQEAELFAGTEMGEDVRRLMDKYRDMCKVVKKQIKTEMPALAQAIKWGKNALNA